MGIGSSRLEHYAASSILEEAPAPPPRQAQPQGAYESPPPLQQQCGHSMPHDHTSGDSTVRAPRLDRRYSRIADDYHSVDQVTQALVEAGLESLNLIIGIDFTRSNEWTGKFSFNGRSLHAIGHPPNPYEQAISIIGRTLLAFDEDHLIPCYGFGDASTHDKGVFCFYPDERPCSGFKEVLERYRELVPHLKLAGPTSFAPIIEMATTVIEQSGGKHHVLLIIADGQVASIDTVSGQLKIQDQKSVDAIANASKFPLSIVLVGVGDGPWDMMKEFDCNIPARAFHNFQFVNFSEIMSKNSLQPRKEAAFAFAALSKIPEQFKAAMELGILGQISSASRGRGSLPPPIGSLGAYFDGPGRLRMTRTDPQNLSLPSSCNLKSALAALGTLATCEYQVCAICLTNPLHVAFGCGHQICSSCGPCLKLCPICRSPITTRITLHCHEIAHMAAPSAYESKDVCPVCLENTKDMAFGCGHLTCCDCGSCLQTCPICHRPITAKIKLY